MQFARHDLLTFLHRQPDLARIGLPQTATPLADLPQSMVDQGLMAAPDMRAMLERFYGVPAISLDAFEPQPEALAASTVEACREKIMVPLSLEGGVFTVALADPWDIDLLTALEMESGLTVSPRLALKTEVLDAVRRWYESSDQLQRAISALVSDRAIDGEIVLEGAAMEDPNAPVVKLVRYFLQQGLALGASDIHLEPYPTHSALRYRVDGVLHPYDGPPRDMHDAVIARLKVLANLDVTETRVPQDGRITFRQGNRTVEFRVSTMPFAGGEGVVLRILDKSNVVVDIRSLGFPVDLLPLFEKAVESPNGLILVSGPTGSGKSTTLYAALKDIATSDRKVITVEDPVEYKMVGVCQSAVRPDIGYTFATGLRSILRHDPDVVMIGEMRDQESADIAVRAALTGHLVLSTIHTNDAISVITRLVDMDVAHFLVSATLRLAIAQRLVRKLCSYCKSTKMVAKAELTRVLRDEQVAAQFPDSLTIGVAVGCPACKNLGYRGRTAIYEVLDARALFDSLRDPAVSPREMREAARAIGLRTLRTNGILKMIDGDTSLEEVLKTTEYV